MTILVCTIAVYRKSSHYGVSNRVLSLRTLTAHKVMLLISGRKMMPGRVCYSNSIFIYIFLHGVQKQRRECLCHLDFWRNKYIKKAINSE